MARKINESEKKRFEAFTQELAKLSVKYGIAIEGCGCVVWDDFASVEYDADYTSGDININWDNTLINEAVKPSAVAHYVPLNKARAWFKEDFPLFHQLLPLLTQYRIIGDVVNSYIARSSIQTALEAAGYDAKAVMFQFDHDVISLAVKSDQLSKVV